MRIPLDYYRILSIPIQANSQQLEQAYSDRLLQQPRREYNEQAIFARQSLIEQAYQVLSDSEQRTEYDAQFLIGMQPIATAVDESEPNEPVENNDSDGSTESGEIAENEEIVPEPEIADVPLVTSTIDILPAQLVGALLILHELGEYELVLTLGIDYYNSQEFDRLQQQQDEEINLATQENIILSLALAYMELGREQWHRQEYEPAAVSSQLGINLLDQENLFPQVKQELELDLDKLRPYRVLELISQNAPNSAPREKGFELLQEMLVQREGVEGKGQDRSGLSFDRFLCFIQQLRTYLTSVEQQKLFDSDIQQDSAIASYLAVYVLLGRGFSYQQPELILRAQRKLDYLSVKQDVTWEQAVCALLLGHTEKALALVHQSQDTSKLNQILQHAPGDEDLLPGMCFYGEQWLYEDVLSQFVDLVNTKLTLKQYFAEPEVQVYLNELAPVTASAIASNSASQVLPTPLEDKTPQAEGVAILSRWRSLFSTSKTTSKTADERAIVADRESNEAAVLVGAGVAAKGSSQQNNRTTAATKQRSGGKSQSRKIVRPQQKSDDRTLIDSDLLRDNSYPNKPRATGKLHNKNGKGNGNKPSRNSIKAKSTKKPKSPSLPLQPKRAVPPSVVKKAAGRTKQQNARKKTTNPAVILKGWLFVFGLIFGAVALGYVATKLFLNPTQKTAKETQLGIAISQPNIELPPVKPKPIVAKPKPTFIQQSQQVIDRWLKSKSAAFGKEHKIAQLDSILVEPLLTTWRDRAIDYQEGDFYREYQHQIKMRTAKVHPQNPNQATVEAEVKEKAQHYQSGQLDSTQSYDDNLLVRYQLVRQGKEWLIKSTEVLETL